MSTAAIFVVLIAFVCALLFVAWRKRRRIRQAIDAFAAQFGLRRLRGETDEELRERCAQALGLRVPSGSRVELEHLAHDLLWGHGYRRAKVVVRPLSPGVIGVRVQSPPVPVEVLRVVQKEMGDLIPCGTILEIEAAGGGGA